MDASGHTNSHFAPEKASKLLLSPNSEESVNNYPVNGNHANGRDVNGTRANGHGVNGNNANASGPHAREATDDNHHLNDSLPPTTADCINASLIPIAICGMACRLPGGIDCPDALWDFLISKGDARPRVPETRYNVSAYHSDMHARYDCLSTATSWTLVWTSKLLTHLFSMPKSEVERLNPQQRLLLEVSREALDDAGEVKWRGENIGVYIGSFGQDWYDLSVQDPQKYGMYQVTV